MAKQSASDEALGELLEAYLPVAYRFARWMLADHHAAEDVAQDAFLRAWKQRKSLRGVASGRAWLLRITANLCRDRLRRLKHPAGRPGPIAETTLVGRETPPDLLMQNEQMHAIRAAMQALPPRHREVLYLRSVERMKLREIAEVLDLTLANTKVCLSRARNSIRDQLREPRMLGEDGR